MSRISDKIFEKIPHYKFDNTKSARVINWFGENVSTPENRVIIGVTALMSQPFIDYYNKDVDEKTRKVSCARTIGKNIAGMLTGYSVRAGFIKLTRNYSKLNANSKMERFFTPSNAKKDLAFAYKQYQNAMGMVLAIAGLTVTNFLVDAPLTNWITNAIVKKFHIENEGKQDGKH